MKPASNKGFTLIEMSMVMLVLAFLCGGILLGREMIYAAQIRATIKQTEMFKLAYNTFRLKYNCLPGDCSTATAMGFTGGFTVKVSQLDLSAPDGFIDRLNPISNAYASLLQDMDLHVGGGMSQRGGGQGGFTQNDNATQQSNFSTLSLDGNGNGKIDNDLPNTGEGPVGHGMLAEARLIQGYIFDVGRVYLPLTDAGANVGGNFKRAFWVTAQLDGGIVDSLSDKLFLMPIASFLPFSAAALSVNATQVIDIKTDDGGPLSGIMRANSNATLNLTSGPVLLESRDVNLPNSCLKYDESGKIIYYNEDYNGVSSIRRCAVVISLGVS